MKYIKEFWEFLNEKKTIIGLIGLNIMQLPILAIVNMNPDLKTLLLWAFGALAGIGAGHKLKKKFKK
jgi:hypothetical protein